MLSSQVFTSYIINKKCGTEALGTYALVLAIAQIVVQGFSAPFSSLIRRDLAIGNVNVREFIKNILTLRLGNIFIVILSLFLIEPVLSYQLLQIRSFLILMFLIKGIEMMNDTYFVTYQALSKYKLYALLKIGNATFVWIGLILLLYINPDVHYFYYIPIFIGSIFLVINFFLFKLNTNYSKSSIQNHSIKGPSQIKTLLKETWPIMINSLAYQASAKLNAIVLFNFIGSKAVGVFSVFLMFSNIFAGLGNPIGIVFIGKYSIFIEKSAEKFEAYFRKTIIAFLGIGILLCTTFIIFIPNILYYYKFDIPNLKLISLIIALSIPFAFATGCIGNIFVVLRKQLLGMYISFVMLFLNLLFFTFFVNFWGLNGATFAYLLCTFLQLLLIVILAFMVNKKLINSDSNRLNSGHT